MPKILYLDEDLVLITNNEVEIENCIKQLLQMKRCLTAREIWYSLKDVFITSEEHVKRVLSRMIKEGIVDKCKDGRKIVYRLKA